MEEAEVTARSLASRSAAAAAVLSLAITSVDKIMQVPVHCPASSQHSISVLSRVFRRAILLVRDYSTKLHQILYRRTGANVVNQLIDSNVPRMDSHVPVGETKHGYQADEMAKCSPKQQAVQLSDLIHIYRRYADRRTCLSEHIFMRGWQELQRAKCSITGVEVS